MDGLALSGILPAPLIILPGCGAIGAFLQLPVL
jgi:hypothetical protein